MWVILWTVVLIIFLLLIWVMCWLHGFIRTKVFCPSRGCHWTPKNARDIYISPQTYQEVSVDSPSYLHAWHLDHQASQNRSDSVISHKAKYHQPKVVLFCHGSNGNMSYRRYIVDLCKQFGLNLFLFDYRGYGQSTGRCDQDSVLRDGEVAYHYLTQFYSPKQIIIWGESLGGAVASRLAALYPCDRLVLFSTFTSIDDAAVYLYGCHEFKSTINFVCDWTVNTLPSKYLLGQVRCPVLIVHSKEDDYIPYKCAEDLH